jgi:glycosyltransferase involved in cell wall biosynthesis
MALRIFHIVPSLDPARGGPPMVAVRLAAAQAALGCHVSIAGMIHPSALGAINAEYARIPGWNYVHLHALPPIPWRNLFIGGALRAACRQIVRAADIVHLHGLWEPQIKFTADAARAAGVPYALTTHGMLDPWSLRQKRLKKRLALALAYRRMVNGAAFLHFLNSDEQRLIEPLGFRAPVEVISNGVFLEETELLPAPGAFRRQHPEIGDAPYVLFLSRLHFKKGLDYLCDSFALVNDLRAHLVVAGPDDGERAEFERRVARANLADRVHLVGPLYGREKVAAMVDAACFCLPSRQEGFSMAILESLAAGLPPVISDACHFPEVAEAGAGIVTPLDPPRIAAAIDSLLSDPVRRASMSAAAVDLVRTRYTWQAIASKSLAAYAKHIPAKAGLV